MNTHIKPFYQSFMAALLGAVLVCGALSPVAEAKWPFKDKEDKKAKPAIENFEPPAEDTLKAHCEPIEKKVAELNQNTPRFFEIFVVPRREYLVKKHRECKEAYMNQEFQYLKHAEVANPKLDPIDKPLEKPRPMPEEKETEKTEADKTETGKTGSSGQTEVPK